MVVLVLNNTPRNTKEGFGMWLKIFIQVVDGYFIGAQHILPYLRNAETTFIIRPFPAAKRCNTGVDE